MDDYEFDYLADFRSMNAEFAENMANYQFVEWFKKMQDEPAIEDLDGADFSVRQETYQRMIKMWKNSQLSPEALSRLSPAEQESAVNIRRMVDEDMENYQFAGDYVERAAVSKSRRDALFRENEKLKAQSNTDATTIEKAYQKGVELQQIRRANAAGSFEIGDDFDLEDDDGLTDVDRGLLKWDKRFAKSKAGKVPDPEGSVYDGDSFDGDYDDEVETVIETGPGGDVELMVLPGRAPAPGTQKYIMDQLDAAIDQKPMPTYELPAPDPVPDAAFKTWESRRVMEPLDPVKPDAGPVDPFAAEPGATVPLLPPPPGDSKIRPGEMDFGKTPDPEGADPLLKQTPENPEDWFDPATKRSVFKKLFGGKSRSDVPPELRDFYDELNVPYAPKSGGIKNWFKRQLGIKKLPGLESAEQGATRLDELGKPVGGDAFGDTGPTPKPFKDAPGGADEYEHKYDDDEDMFDAEGRAVDPERARAQSGSCRRTAARGGENGQPARGADRIQRQTPLETRRRSNRTKALALAAPANSGLNRARLGAGLPDSEPARSWGSWLSDR